MAARDAAGPHAPPDEWFDANDLCTTVALKASHTLHEQTVIQARNAALLAYGANLPPKQKRASKHTNAVLKITDDASLSLTQKATRLKIASDQLVAASKEVKKAKARSVKKAEVAKDKRASRKKRRQENPPSSHSRAKTPSPPPTLSDVGKLAKAEGDAKKARIANA